MWWVYLYPCVKYRPSLPLPLFILATSFACIRRLKREVYLREGGEAPLSSGCLLPRCGDPMRTKITKRTSSFISIEKEQAVQPESNSCIGYVENSFRGAANPPFYVTRRWQRTNVKACPCPFLQWLSVRMQIDMDFL